MKKVRVILSEPSAEAYKKLNENANDSKIEKSLLKSIDNKIYKYKKK